MKNLLTKLMYGVLLSTLWSTVPAAADRPYEYQLKAAFLTRFARYVEWPDSLDTGKKNQPLVIGILGKDPFASLIDEILAKKKSNGRAVVVKRFAKLEDLESSHILYISDSEAQDIKEILVQLEQKPVLTVGDMKGFTSVGGMIQFITRGERIQLQIRNEAVKAAGLQINAKLLKVARVVDGKSKDK